MDSYFYPFIKLLSAFFLFCHKMQAKQDQTVLQQVAIYQRNTNEHCIKHKTESQTTQIISVFGIFIRSYLPVQNLGETNIQILQSWLAGQFGQLSVFIFLIHFTTSKLIVTSIPVLKLPENSYYSLFQVFICYKESSNYRKYRHKSICINNTQ